MDLLRLRRPEPPCLHLLLATESEACHLLETLPSVLPSVVVCRVVRGDKARTKATLFDEFAAAFQFPLYFGENWDALDECLNDLAWLSANSYILLIVRSIHLLDKECEEQLACLLKILQGVGENWGKSAADPSRHPPRSFHVLLQSTKEDECSLRDKLSAVGVVFDVMQC